MINNDPETTTFFTGLLNLPDIVVEIRNSPNDRDVIICVKSTRESVPCRTCGQLTRNHGSGRPLRLRHLPLLGKETYTEITPRRSCCEHCKDSPTTTERLDGYELNSKMTKLFEHHLLFELISSTTVDVSRKENVDYHAVDSLITHYIERKKHDIICFLRNITRRLRNTIQVACCDL